MSFKSLLERSRQNSLCSPRSVWESVTGNALVYLITGIWPNRLAPSPQSITAAKNKRDVLPCMSFKSFQPHSRPYTLIWALSGSAREGFSAESESVVELSSGSANR